MLAFLLLNQNKLNKMKKKISLQVIFIIGIQFLASAQAAFNNNSDIVGLNLSMSRDEAIAFLSKNYYIIDQVEIKDKVIFGSITSKEMFYAHMISITTKEKGESNKDLYIKKFELLRTQGGGRTTNPRRALVIENDNNSGSSDIITLGLDLDDSNKIIGIKRVKTYATKEAPLSKVFHGSIIEKYGNPNAIKKNPSFQPYGPAENGVWANFSMPPSPTKDKWFDYYECYYALNLIDNQLSNILDQVASDLHKNTIKCNGTSMNLESIRYSQDREYVIGFTQVMGNAANYANSVVKIKNQLIKENEDANNNRIKQDSKRKPLL